MLALLKDYILFAEKDEELQKFILRQHQTAAVEWGAFMSSHGVRAREPSIV